MRKIAVVLAVPVAIGAVLVGHREGLASRPKGRDGVRELGRQSSAPRSRAGGQRALRDCHARAGRAEIRDEAADSGPSGGGRTAGIDSIVSTLLSNPLARPGSTRRPVEST